MAPRATSINEICLALRIFMTQGLKPLFLRISHFQLLKLPATSNIYSDVPALWSETEFHGLFDAEVFSCSVGLRKPDPRIYLLCCEQLGVEPSDAIFVGDGANDELAGAERVGMTAVLLEGSPEEPDSWVGHRIRALPELLALV